MDIGCNAGIFAITLALHFKPKKVVGIDIDKHLIRAARKNISFFVDNETKVNISLIILIYYFTITR